MGIDLVIQPYDTVQTHDWNIHEPKKRLQCRNYTDSSMEE